MRSDHNELVDLAQAFSIKIWNVFHGRNFAGHWRRAVTVNRLIYIFAEAPIPSRITGEHQTFEMKPGHWLFIPAGHTAEHEQYEGLDLVSIHFNLMFYSNPDILSISRDFHQGYAPEWMESFRRLTCEEPPGLSDVLHLQGLLCNFMTSILQKEQKDLKQYFLDLQTFQPLFDAFQKDPFRNFSVDDMARMMKMGKESFVKKFTAAMNTSPKKLFNRLRATNAAHQLNTSQAAIREISEAFGFANEFYFSRFIKQYLGMSPREWRNKKRLPM